MRNLTEKEKFCLSAMLLGESVDLAYVLSRNSPPKADNNIHRMALRWARSAECKEYLSKRRLALSLPSNKEDTSLPNERNIIRRKSDIVEELNALASSEPDVKKKVDILMKIAELERMKNEENKIEEERIHYYLPVSCSHCPYANDG